MKKLILLATIISLLLISGIAVAQDDSSSDFTSTVFYYWAACNDRAVIDLNGTMQSGYDVYVQVFRETNASGEALTGLMRVPVDGAYEVSQSISYTSGQLNLGQFASLRVSIAREGDASSTLFTEVFDDVNDECIEPSYGSIDTINADGTGGGTPLIDPVTGEVVTGTEGTALRSSGIFTPDGGILNEVYGRPLEAVVQIGARPSENEEEQGRVSDPGLIFAECDMYDGADPGRVWDVDNVTVFWSWYASTPEEVRDHIAKAQYEVFLSSPYAWRQPFPNVQLTPVVQREDDNYWVFFVADLGTGFRPGQYRVDYYVTWPEVISDGYEEFGPGTATPSILSTCTFEVEINPYDVDVERHNPTVPLQQ